MSYPATCAECGAHYTGRMEHCTVPGCHLTFSCTAVGDRHRVGEHGVTTGPDRRRCLTADEFAALAGQDGTPKVKLNARGVWVGGGEWPGKGARQESAGLAALAPTPVHPQGCEAAQGAILAVGAMTRRTVTRIDCPESECPTCTEEES